MEENIKTDISMRPKPPILNLAKSLDNYMQTRVKLENPNASQYDAMHDFIYKTKHSLLGIGYLPLSKYDRRVASKLYDILNTEIIINRKIITADNIESDASITRKQEDLENMRKELLAIIFGNIYTCTYVETKVLGTFTPKEIVDFCDMFDEGLIKILQKWETKERNDELAAGVTGDDDETDIAETFHEKVIQHHEINRPIGNILEDLFDTKRVSYKHIFNKTLEHANIIRAYFNNYPEIFIISFCTFLDHTKMHQAFEKIFPEKYNIPDIKNYIDNRYGMSDDDYEE